MTSKMTFFLLAPTIATILACSGDPDSSRHDASLGVDSLTFQNPEFECATENLVEPDQGYPHPVRQFPFTPEPDRPVAELEDFCARMQERFAEPGLTDSEARSVYEVIPTVLNIQDEPYGMPSPEQPPPPEVELTERVQLRKIEEDRYEIFFFTIGCGRNYSLYELTLTETGAEVRPIERWSESSPC
jgi:hypothetical protein